MRKFTQISQKFNINIMHSIRTIEIKQCYNKRMDNLFPLSMNTKAYNSFDKGSKVL